MPDALPPDSGRAWTGHNVTQGEIAVIMNKLENVVEKFDDFERRMEIKLDRFALDHDRYESRIDNLERWRAYLTGALAMLFLVVSVGAAWITLLIQR
jgi:hypothetical protein